MIAIVPSVYAAEQPAPEKTEIDNHTSVIIGSVFGILGSLLVIAIVIVIAIIIFMKIRKKDGYKVGVFQAGYHIENEYTSNRLHL